MEHDAGKLNIRVDVSVMCAVHLNTVAMSAASRSWPVCLTKEKMLGNCLRNSKIPKYCPSFCTVHMWNASSLIQRPHTPNLTGSTANFLDSETTKHNQRSCFRVRAVLAPGMDLHNIRQLVLMLWLITVCRPFA